MLILYCFAFLLGFLGFQGCEALKCLEEIPGQQPLHTINCAYFAFGDAQVCYSIKKIQDDGYSLGLIRGCQYLTRLGKLDASYFWKEGSVSFFWSRASCFYQLIFDTNSHHLSEFFEGINVGPIKNLTEEWACELRKPNQDELGLDHGLNEIEVCVCVQDLCNTYNNGANATKQPILFSMLENKATAVISVHFIVQILYSFLLSWILSFDIFLFYFFSLFMYVSKYEIVITVISCSKKAFSI